MLLASGEPSATAVVQLVKQFQEQNPALREAAIRRLLPYPNVARRLVIKAFREGKLSARLAAFELLEQWKAPLADLDPWRPETFTRERLARLDKWKDREPPATSRRRRSSRTSNWPTPGVRSNACSAPTRRRPTPSGSAWHGSDRPCCRRSTRD